ncbi:MAG: MATE family efflux transporter [Oscillospiraceae bacterium]
MNRNSDKSDSRVFYRNVFALVVPMALQNLINVAVTSADVMMLGQTGEQPCSPPPRSPERVSSSMTLFSSALRAAAPAILTAQYWGKGDTRTGIEKVMEHRTALLALCTALVFALAAFLIPARKLMRIFTPEEDVIAEGVKYLRIIAVSYVPMALTNIYLNIMRSVERVVVSTVTYLVSLVTNVALNAVFIFGLLGFPAMGIQGAALATVCARLVELVIVLVYSKDQPHGAPERPRYLCA